MVLLAPEIQVPVDPNIVGLAIDSVLFGRTAAYEVLAVDQHQPSGDQILSVQRVPADAHADQMPGHQQTAGLNPFNCPV